MGVHEATYLLKEFLEKLPDSIIPLAYDRKELENYSPAEFKKLMLEIPRECYFILDEVLFLLT